jgi:anti-sigma-K factor RskA
VDIKAYIESGILESYVLRLTSQEESAEVESMMAAHPEIASAVNEFEIKLEQQFMDNAIQPSSDVKGALFAALEHEFTANATPHETKVISIKPATPFWKYMAAASIILFLASTIFNVYYYNKFSELENNYNVLLANNGTLLAKSEANQTRMNDMEKSMLVMKDTATLKIPLKDVKGASNLATVYWNSISKDVFVLQNNLPKAPQGKQYQLWAIVDGKTVNAGMLENCEQALCVMRNIPTAQAFAITLEKEGGSPTPDMANLMVMGKI